MCSVLNGFPFKSPLFNREKGFPVVRIRDLSKGATHTMYSGDVPPEVVVSDGDLLVGMDGLFRCYEWRGGEAGLNQRVCKIVPNEQFLNRRFLLFGINGYLRAIEDATSSVTVGHLSSKDILRIPFPLPPLSEQSRIVAKLEQLLRKVDACQKRLANLPVLLKRFRQSVLAAAYSGRLTADWREDHVGIEDAERLIARIGESRRDRCEKLRHTRRRMIALGNFDNLEPSLRTDLELPELPRTWRWVDLRFVMMPEEPFCYGVVQPGEDDRNGPRLVRVCDLDGGQVLASNLRGIPPAVHAEYARSILTGGEVVVSVVGTIGRSAIVPPWLAGANIARAIAKVPVREFEARFIALWLSTSRAETWMVGDAREVARKTLNLEQLRTLPTPLAPVLEQQEIIRRVDGLFALASGIEARAAKAQGHIDELTPSMLAKAFRGELVATEAELARREGRSFEQASILLDRIRVERGSAGQGAAGRSIDGGRPSTRRTSRAAR